MCAMCMQVVWRSEEVVGYPGTGIAGGCEPFMSGLGPEPWSSVKAASVLNYSSLFMHAHSF